MRKVNRQYSLGDKITVNGKYVLREQEPWKVEIMRENVLKGHELSSRKYDVLSFDKPKQGIVVGRRTLGIKRKHISTSRGFPYTYTSEYETVYLVATDLRGLIYVPEECVLIENENTNDKMSIS